MSANSRRAPPSAIWRARAFRPGDAPFYHFAFLVGDDRFDEAVQWLRRAGDLLADPRSGATRFDFDFWDATACYVQDPDGNIVELIAHRGVAGPADQTEDPPLLGISEIALVAELPAALAENLHEHLGLEVWDGDVREPEGLLFAGRKAHTFILAPRGRGWLPPDQTADIHPVTVQLSRGRTGVVAPRGLPYRVFGRGGIDQPASE